MRNGSPDTTPGQKLGVQLSNPLGDSNVVDGVIEQTDQTSNTHNRQRLRRKQTKHQRRQSRGKERFVQSKEAFGSSLHVQHERYSGQEVDEEDADGANGGLVVEAICYVTSVVGETSPDVPVYTSTGSEDSVGFPACLVVPGVGVALGEVYHCCGLDGTELM